MKYLLLTVLVLIMHSQNVVGQTLHWLSQPEVDIGTVPDNETDDARLSRNGRYISFISSASNLVANDNNRVEDVFIKDRQTGAVELVSITSNGTQATAGRISKISAPTSDGRYVAFISDAIGLPQANGIDNYLYLKDLQTGDLINESGYSSNLFFIATSDELFLSDDGLSVIFTTSNHIDPLHDNSRKQVYHKDIANSSYALLSTSLDGLAEADSNTRVKNVSNTGRYVLMASYADNLTSDTINNIGENLFILDRQDNSRVLVNITPTGNNSSDSESTSNKAAISNFGQVVFRSDQEDLVTNDSNNRDDVFYFDNGIIIRINLDANGDELTSSNTANSAEISGDGSRIAFTENSDELFPLSTSDYPSLYSYVTASGVLSLVSKNADGNKANAHSYNPQLSTSGNRVAFTSYATDLSLEPSTGQHQAIFSYSFTNDVMKNESQAFFSPSTLIANADNPRTSSDQMSVIYSSKSPNIVFEPIDDESIDLFLLDRHTNTHSKITSNVSTYETDISASGNYVSFRTRYLPPDGLTDLGDYYVYLFDRVNNTYTQIAQGGKNAVTDDGAVVFDSFEDLDINDTNSQLDVYAYNPVSQNIVLISQELSGFASTAEDMDIGGSGNNIWVTFSSDSSGIVVNDTNASEDVFIKNLSTGSAITRVTQVSAALGANGSSYSPVFSEDANWIALLTDADNLTNDDYSSAYSTQVLLFDRINQSFSLVSKNDSGVPITQASSGGISSGSVSVSDSGRYISYAYEDRLNEGGNKGTIIIPNFAGDIDGEMDAVLFDTDTQTPKIVSKHISGEQSTDKVEGSTHVVENLTASPSLVGVLFQAGGGDLTNLSSHPGHREVFLYQQPTSDFVFENGFE